MFLKAFVLLLNGYAGQLTTLPLFARTLKCGVYQGMIGTCRIFSNRIDITKNDAALDG
jgi:hypothetical protein